LGAPLVPLLQESELVRRRIATAEQLVDWMMRLMVSAFLLPGRDADAMTEGLTAAYRILTGPVAGAAPARVTRQPPAQRRAHAVRRVRRAAAAAEKKRATGTRARVQPREK